MQRNSVETILGAVVLCVAGGFLAFAYQSANLRPVEGYTVTAKFNSVDGLGTGSDVRIGGIKVGVVSGLELDTKTYQAVAKLQLREGVQVPVDSGASVSSDGLLGGKYIAIEPGADDALMKSGDQIEFTQSSVSIESLIGKFMHGGVDENGKGKPQSADVTAPAISADKPVADEPAAPAAE